MAVQAMYALKPTPCFLGGSFMLRGEKRFKTVRLGRLERVGFMQCHNFEFEEPGIPEAIGYPSSPGR